LTGIVNGEPFLHDSLLVRLNQSTEPQHEFTDHRFD